MGRGSVLKNLKSELQNNDLLRHQKRKKGAQQQAKLQKERDEQSLSAIRESFNPFNAKFDKKKGLDPKKTVAGRPVAARSAAEEQRRRTWEAEKRLKNKVGGLLDRRFGERDKTMSEEDKMVERFAREKLNNLRKLGSRKSYNIEEDEEQSHTGEDLLTHGGQTLSFEDDFVEDDLGVESDDDLPQKKKARVERDLQQLPEEAEPSRPKTKAEVMQEVIAKSKMYKLERQQQRQADDELVDTLNADFDELMADLVPAEEQQKAHKREVDSYDINLQELAFEKRADPTDRTKTAEEIAKASEEEAKAAERAKAARMEGDELDIDYDDGVTDDAHLFGLQAHSDEEEVDGDVGDVDNSHDDYAKRNSSVNVPEDLHDLKEALSTTENVGDKVRSYVKVATPGRGSGSKTQLQNLSVAIMEYAILNASEFKILSEVLHDVAPQHDVGMSLANEARDLVQLAKRKKTWGTREVLLFSLIGSLFSTSDQWHVVATSATLVITQRLSQSVDSDLKIITINLFLCELLLIYQRLSKRYIPEISGYLLRILTMLSPAKNAIIAERYVRLSPSSLVKTKNPTPIPRSVSGKAHLGQPASLNDIAVIAAKITSKSASLWRSIEGFPEIFTPLHICFSNISHDKNPIITETLSKLEKLIHFSAAERKFLELQHFTPVGIITHAPLFDENYNPEVKGASLDPEQRELQKLKALHKKERKSTLREIRRDAEFEARQSLEEKRKSMAEYHDKLKRLEGQINGEEGAERNAYEREKKKRGRR